MNIRISFPQSGPYLNYLKKMKPGRLNAEPSLKEPIREPKDSFPREPWSVSQLKAEESCATEILGCNNNSI